MKIFISTGEVSGDLQGSMLVKSLYQTAAQRQIDLKIAGLGGDRMKSAGAQIIADTAAIGSMGFIEAIPFILPTVKIQRLTKKYLQENIPDVLVLIDYPASNLALASYVKQHLPQICVVYYIAPQDWAVPMLNNAGKIAKVVDKLLAIFPGEYEYFKTKNIDAVLVGHPLLDRMEHAPTKEQARLNLGLELSHTIVTILPASRQQEIKYLLPAMCAAAQQILKQMPEVKFLIPVSLASYHSAITSTVAEYNLPVQILDGNTLDAIAAANLAIAKSGTVNLEIALLNIPQVVIYRINPLTAWIGRRIGFEVPLMSPPNLVMERMVVPELQQEAVTAENITTEAMKLLSNSTIQAEISAGYQEMRSRLGTVGVCDRVAIEIFQLIEKTK
ncbi:lipid-A-disaccharide synthase [Pleurocapsa sp. CCALA 161]|uniref:lipid-A-disaccharide synthase n=1 Tax=Pleurocapsa sp. CCALA 161 TaxID=2107688 RepID=UPI000D06B838|nr:lipid-A-disaccharide synthase [Pleurocapsa sp. CCALA 161]PSB05570.1 lipid-A-disaccharide synthase [Pleurocapsa sp. CCALA 161]